jgi:hypothetical protein
MAQYRLRIGHVRTFTDNFATDQNPLGSPWLANVTPGLTAMTAAGGRAVGLAQGAGLYDDSAALLDGFGANYEITATVFKGTGLAETTHEMELLLRSTQQEDIVEQYECLFAFDGSVSLVLWFDDGGTQGFEVLTPDSGTGAIGRALITGDRIRASVSGSTITMQFIEADNTVHTAIVKSDSSYPTGKPGIGAYTRAEQGGDLTKFCFESVTVRQL